MFKYSDIRVVHLEISSRCNAACPDCPRNLRGVEVADIFNDFEVRDMTLAEVKKLFPVDFLSQLHMILINGNHGDFITCREGLEIIKYFSESNPYMQIEISTNASGQPKIWSQLGAIPNVKVLFRLDGLADTHHLYRQYTDFNLIINNAKLFIAAGGNAEWHMIAFDFNEHQREDAKLLSEQLGFKRFELVDVGRNNMVVFDKNGNYSHTIGNPTHDQQDFISLMEVRKTRRLDTTYQLQFYEKYPAKEINCKVKNPAWIYVQSNGQVYPCCWTGRAPDTNPIASGNEQISALSKNNNALEIGLEAAIDWFNELERAWQIKTVAAGRPWICNETCGSLGSN
jgi:MoaA/NifB/PqqE/SkfB family radical SAM enzyme